MLALAAVALLTRNAVGQSPAVNSSNPKVGIRLESVSCVEAIAALEKATGVPMALDGRSPRTEQQVEVDRRLAAPASFHWTGTLLGAAMRQLAERYQLGFHARFGGQFVFTPALEPEDSQPLRPAGQLDVGGYRIGISQVSVTRVATDRLAENDLNVGLQVEPLNGDVEAIAGVQNLSAVDDRGTVLKPRDPEQRGWGTLAPDRWTTHLGLPAPAPNARLVSLRGELVTYRRVSRHGTEFELPLRAGGRKWRENGIELELLGFKPHDDAATNLIGGPDPGPSVTGRLKLPVGHQPDQQIASPFGAPHRIPAPLLVGASGRSYAPSGTQSALEPGPADPELGQSLVWSYPPVNEPIRKITFAVVRKEMPEHAVTFVLKNVPLPQPDTARAPGVPWLNPVKLAPGHPFYRAGGATVVCPVQVAGRAAPAGRLFLGLAPCRPQTLPGSEWFEAPVRPGAAARFAGVAPGTYRMLRLYYPREPAAVPGHEVWRNSEGIVEVPARGEVLLPPLSRHPRAAPTPQEVRDRAHPVLSEFKRDDEGRIELRTMEMSGLQNATLRFLREPHLKVHQTHTVIAGGGTGKNHSNRLSGLRNVIVCDDRGNLYSAAGGGVTQSNRLWHARFSFSGLSPQAERLAWVEGDVLAWSRVETVRVEIPVPKVRQTVKRTVEGVNVEFTLTPGSGDDEIKKPGVNEGRRGLRLDGRIHAPPSLQLAPPADASSIAPFLVTSEGTSHPLGNAISGGMRDGKGEVCNFNGYFPALDEPATHVWLEFIVKSEPRKVGVIRATDIPIPREKPAEAPAPAQSRSVPVEEGRSVGVEAPAPYFDSRGGNLVQQVRIAGQPAVDGTVSLGFLREDPKDLQSIRWVDARVDGVGAVRVEGLKPGVYRIQSKYQPPGEKSIPGKGRWLNCEARVRIPAGKAVLLPALEWRPAREN